MIQAVIAVVLISSYAAAQTKAHELPASPSTVAWGYYWADAKPVMKIASGDTVRVHTLITNSPQRLEQNGVPADQVEQSLKDIYEQVKGDAKGPGGHILTGPIYVEGAEPGDTLEIRIQKTELALPYAYNGFGPNRGFLPEDFTYGKTKIIPLDKKRMVADFAPGITIPLHPFFGSIGVAPPPEDGRISSVPPGKHGGNMDNKELVAGTTLFLPVYAPGALVFIGDGHAGQGNGEVDITALETSLIGTFQFLVHKGEKLEYPRGETPTHYISMGFDKDLTEATKMAVRHMIDFLQQAKGLTKDDAYMLTSVAGDVDISELVDDNKGVHVMMPKAIFAAEKKSPPPRH